MNVFKKMKIIFILQLLLYFKFISCNSNIKSYPYTAIPSDYKLIVVSVVFRHGDRTQISKELGPSFPESDTIASFWNNKLPIESTQRLMTLAAFPSIPFHSESKYLKYRLYAGWDHLHYPYGQLTEIGSQQLIEVGKLLRSRYILERINDNPVPFIPHTLHDAADVLYCRSSNLCRTIQSLRSLLIGMFNVTANNLSRNNIDGINFNNSLGNYLFSRTTKRNGRPRPLIITKPKSRETLYPYADGPCPVMGELRSKLIANKYNNGDNYPSFIKELEIKLKKSLGFEKLNWLNYLNIMDIFTCYNTHNIELPAGISSLEAIQVHNFTSWMWGALYKNKQLSSLAIGKFIRNMLDDIDIVVNKISNIVKVPVFGINRTVNNNNIVNDRHDYTLEERLSTSNVNTRLMIYSGHDSTLVPLLVVLGIYEDVGWPPYAAYLSFEIVLSKSSNKFFLRTSYLKNDYVIKGCQNYGIWCPLSIFIELLESISLTPIQYKKMCFANKVKIIDSFFHY